MVGRNNSVSRRKILQASAAATVATPLLAGCSGGSGDDVSDLGIVGPISGQGSAIVTQSLGGYELALEDAAERHDEFEYEIHTHDAGLTQPDETASGVEQLYQQDNVNIFQTFFSPPTLAAFPKIREQNSLLLTSATSQPLIEADYQNLLINNIWAEDSAVATAMYADEELGWDDAAYMTTNDQYGDSLLEFNREHFENHGISLQPEQFEPGTQDFTNILSRLRDSGLDGVVLGTYQPYVGTIIGQASQIGWHLPQGEDGPKGIGIFGGNDPSLLDQVDTETLDGWIIVDGPSPTATSATRDLNQRYQELNDTPSMYLTILSYWTATAVADAIVETDADPMSEVGEIRSEIGQRGPENLYEILGLEFYWDDNGRMRTPFSIVEYDGDQPETTGQISIDEVLSEIE